MFRTLLHAGTTPLLYFVQTVFLFQLSAIDRPHPEYMVGHWFTDRLAVGFLVASYSAVFMFVVVAIDTAFRIVHAQPRGVKLAFYPRFNEAGRWIRCPKARSTIIIGMLCLTAYYMHSAIEVYVQRLGAGGLVWPPERLFTVLLLGWGVLWIADCLVRPNYETIGAAVAYVAFVVFFIGPAGGSIVRE